MSLFNFIIFILDLPQEVFNWPPLVALLQVSAILGVISLNFLKKRRLSPLILIAEMNPTGRNK
jgi:hypothetical protein